MLLSPFNHKGKDHKFVPLVGGLFIALILLVGVEIWPNNESLRQGTILGIAKEGSLLIRDGLSQSFKLLASNAEINNLVAKISQDSSDLKQSVKAVENSSKDEWLSLANDFQAPSLGINNLSAVFLSGVDDSKSLVDQSIYSVKSAVDNEIRGVVSGFSQAYGKNNSADREVSVSLSLHPIQIASVMSALDGVSENIDKGFQVFDNFVERILLNIKYYYNRLIEKWSAFLNGDKQSLSEADLANLREQIKADVLAEILAEIENRQVEGSGPITEPEIFQTKTGQGVVIVPASTSTPSVEQVKSQLKNMFSDDTIISFDATGQSGIITPIFKDRRGQDFIFLLTPINRNE